MRPLSGCTGLAAALALPAAAATAQSPQDSLPRLGDLPRGMIPVLLDGKGRTFYCSLGHREEISCEPAILKHYLAGIQYVPGDLDVDASPTVKSAPDGK